jgi:glycosyltransferase involved in cell wall biosynthesis
MSLPMDQQPLVSIVTPSFNMGRFIEETIRSVLDQDYPKIEYLVMDGGSTDGTLDILKHYEGRLRYISKPDRGQTDAINSGFELTRGSIFTFLNADDTLLPGAVATAVRVLEQHPDAGVVYGDAWFVDENGNRISAYPVEPYDASQLARRCFICQPAAFLRREVFASSGRLDRDLHFALDYDLWIRIAQRYSMKKIDGFLATSRMHRDNKTMREMGQMLQRTMELLRHYYGYVPYNWLYGYAYHRRTGQPIAVERPRPCAISACYSIALGAKYNWRHPLRYCRDIVSTAREGLAAPKAH